VNTKATDALLKDHALIRKVLEGFVLDNPRFSHICRTLHRALQGHAWFEDAIFIPAINAEPLVFRQLTDEILQEHRDIHELMILLRKIPLQKSCELEAYALQLRSLVEAHFKKEEDGLFPLAEKLLTEEGLIHLGAELERRKMDVRNILDL